MEGTGASRVQRKISALFFFVRVAVSQRRRKPESRLER